MLGEGLEKPKKSPRGALSTVQNKNGGVTARLVVFEINKVPYHHSFSEISRSESAPEPPIGGPVFGQIKVPIIVGVLDRPPGRGIGFCFVFSLPV